VKKFTKNNQPFTCIKCGYSTPIHPSSSRDHCNNCLCGLHVDIHPGDRANPCQGLLNPIGFEIKNSKSRIVYRCEKCSQIVKNITAPDDSSEEIIKLSGKTYSI